MAGDTANWDGLGVFWTAFAAGWTALLAAGMAFLFQRRSMPILRIRGLPLSFCAILFLHAYWLAVQLGYVYGHLMPNGVEYWIMGIYFPFGVALFHASNSQFLHVAKRQKKYAQLSLPAGGKKRGPQLQAADKKRRGVLKWPLVDRFRRFDYTTKMLAVVAAGMTFQVCLLFSAFFLFSFETEKEKKKERQLTVLVCLDALHVPRLAQIPPFVRHPGHRGHRDARGD